MTCPCCKEPLNEDEILKLIDPKKIKSHAAALAGAAGRGPAKARSSEQAAATARKRWDNYWKARGYRFTATPRDGQVPRPLRENRKPELYFLINPHRAGRVRKCCGGGP